MKRALLLVAMAAAAAVLWATDRPRASPVESSPRVAATAAPVELPRRPQPRPPPPRQVRDALRRVFGDVVVIDAARALAGDFNDDGSEDLAAVARAAPAMLARVNDELANWIVQDAAAAGRSSTRVTVSPSDALLAVLHGHGEQGWRNPEARQAYLVRVSLTRPRLFVDNRGLVQAVPGAPVKHVVVDDTPGHPGFLYWSGSRYVWSADPL